MYAAQEAILEVEVDGELLGADALSFRLRERDARLSGLVDQRAQDVRFARLVSLHQVRRIGREPDQRLARVQRLVTRTRERDRRRRCMSAAQHMRTQQRNRDSHRADRTYKYMFPVTTCTCISNLTGAF